MGGKYIRKARILVARAGAKSIVERGWLNYLQYAIEPKAEGTLKHSINTISKVSENPPKIWTEELKLKFSDLFERRGRIKHHKIHAGLNEGAVIKQQKGRRIPIQLQESVKREITRLLQEGHIVKVGEIIEGCYSYNPQS